MKRDEEFIEQLLYDEAKKIKIDETSKMTLKNIILKKKLKQRKLIYYSCLAASVFILVLLINNKLLIRKKIPEIVEITKVHASQLYIKEKIRLTKIISNSNIFAPEINPEGTKILYSSEDSIYEMNIDGSNKQKLSDMKNVYAPNYSSKGDKIVFAKNEGIFIEDVESKEVKNVIKSTNSYEVYDKPNFTTDGSIIYCKTDFENDPNGTIGGAKKVSEIYKVNENGKNNIKLIDGLNPALSRDGKSLAYEVDGKIYV
jgi:hypothetical protein